MHTVSIGDMVLDLPDFLETRVEDDTLVAFPPRTDFANLRFTVLTVTRDGTEVAGAGETLIRKSAHESNAVLHEYGDKVWYRDTEPASEGSAGSLMHFWYVGMGGRSLLISCFVDGSQLSDPLVERLLGSVEDTIQSFRRNSNRP